MEKKTRTVGEVKAYYTGLMIGNLTELSNTGNPEAVITDMIDRLTNDLMESMKQQKPKGKTRGKVPKTELPPPSSKCIGVSEGEGELPL